MSRHARIVPVADLTATERNAMLALMQRHYAGVDPEDFARNLAEKRWVILLQDGANLYGFSTQMPCEADCGGVRHRLVFSGDTIVAREAWGGLELPIAWGCLMRALRQREERPLHWFLISKGYKTYRFLPVFFHSFYPSRHGDDAQARQLLAAVASARYPGRWDSVAGVIRAQDDSQRLRPGLADPLERADDPDVGYFLARNPGHATGDELACLARFDEDNLRPFIRRRLDRARIELPPLP